MQVFLNIVKIIVGIILLNVAPLVTEEFTIGALIMYAAGAILIILGVITIFRVIIDAVKGNSSGGSRGRSSSRYSSSSSTSSNRSNSDGSLKQPDGQVELLISREIERCLPAVTPSTSIYCDIYGTTAYVKGGITLWHRRDSGAVDSAIRRGFSSALRQASSNGYDVSGLSLSVDISIEAADNN